MPCRHVAYLLWVCIFYFEHAETCGIPSLVMHLLSFFFIAPYPLSNFMREMSYGDMEFLFGGCMSGYITNFQCRSVACGSGRVRDLDHGSMK